MRSIPQAITEQVVNGSGLVSLANAVILISREALKNPDKPWVARETACLICRRYTDPSLLIIPILLDGLTRADLDANERFRDLLVGETKGIFGGNPASIIDEITDFLEGFRPLPETELSKLAKWISAELSGFNQHHIKSALADCEVSLGAWLPSGDVHHELAMRLLTLEVAKLPTVLGALAGFEPAFSANVRRVADILFSNWVEFEAVRGLVEEGRKKTADSTRRALSLNARDRRLAEFYALRAFQKHRPRWKLLQVKGVFGECDDAADAAKKIADEIDREIENKVKIAELTLDEPDEERCVEIKRIERVRKCRNLADTLNPIFVATPIASGFSLLGDVLRILANRYPFATFIFLSSIDRPLSAEPTLDMIRPLVPELSQERYDNYRDLYNDVFANLS